MNRDCSLTNLQIARMINIMQREKGVLHLYFPSMYKDKHVARYKYRLNINLELPSSSS